MGSTRFGNWLALRYYDLFGKPLKNQALGQAKLHVRAVCGTKPRRILSRRVHILCIHEDGARV